MIGNNGISQTFIFLSKAQDGKGIQANFTEFTEPKIQVTSHRNPGALYPHITQSATFEVVFVQSCIQWNFDLSFFKGMEKQNDECGKTINPGNYYTL